VSDGSHWGYRPHLDGLRAVAVYLVVFYHSGADLFRGGFIGVDLFFVLSGYLVTMVLLRELLPSDSVNLRRFYARRVRRLVPAATVVVAVTAVASILIRSPLDRQATVDDATASSLWYANWHFIGELNSYFATDGATSPFVHFWSLSIEEQFYIAFPLCLIGLWRLRPRLGTLMIGVAVTMSASLALQLALAPGDVNRAYLGTDTRVYQILVGSLLAMAFLRWNPVGRLRQRSGAPKVALLIAAAGVVTLVLSATSLLDVSASWRGVIAAALSVALIAALELCAGGFVVGALSLAPVRYLGQVSYGTYLWHWPVIVLAGDLLDMPAPVLAAVGALVGTGLAALSAALLELPIRTSRRLDEGPRGVILAGVVSAIVVGAVLTPQLLESDRRPVVHGRNDGVVAASAAGMASPTPQLDWASIEATQPDPPPCQRADLSDCFVTSGENGTLLLIGDSHARMLLPAFEAAASERGLALAVAFAPSCPWQRDLLAGTGDGDRFTDRCRRERGRTYDEIVPRLDPDVIAVVGFPRSTTVGGGAFTDRDDWRHLSVTELVAAATRTTIESLVDDGRAILAIEPVPILTANQLSCLSASASIEACAMSPYPEGVEEAVLGRLDESSVNVVSLDLDGRICPSLPLCEAVVDGMVTRRDSHHLTPAFAATFADEIGAAIDELVVQARGGGD
jgi:peptidoglycan/LPS O-acetylase OafA/YrhL